MLCCFEIWYTTVAVILFTDFKNGAGTQFGCGFFYLFIDYSVICRPIFKIIFIRENNLSNMIGHRNIIWWDPFRCINTLYFQSYMCTMYCTNIYFYRYRYVFRETVEKFVSLKSKVALVYVINSHYLINWCFLSKCMNTAVFRNLGNYNDYLCTHGCLQPDFKAILNVAGHKVGVITINLGQ